jgi:hypothetical protein
MPDSNKKKGSPEWSRPQRFAFRATLEIEWGSSILKGVTRDISSNGMFIEADSPQTRSAGEGGLRGEARRTRTRHGRDDYSFGARERKVFPATYRGSFETEALIPLYNKNDDTLP